jgi:hypothetical protein
MTAAVPGALLGEVSPRLLYLLTTWRQQPRQRRNPGGTLVGRWRAADRAALRAAGPMSRHRY